MVTLYPCSISFLKASAWAAVSAGTRYGTLQWSSGPIPTCSVTTFMFSATQRDLHAGPNPIAEPEHTGRYLVGRIVNEEAGH